MYCRDVSELGILPWSSFRCDEEFELFAVAAARVLQVLAGWLGRREVWAEVLGKPSGGGHCAGSPSRRRPRSNAALIVPVLDAHWWRGHFGSLPAFILAARRVAA